MPHKLELKIHAQVILLRNLSGGLCNVTRLNIKVLYKYNIEAVYYDDTDNNEFILKKKNLKIVYFKVYELMTFTYLRANKIPPSTNTKVALKPQ